MGSAEDNLILMWSQKCLATELCYMHPLTSTCCIHSNVYGLGDIHYIRDLTAVDSILSTSPAVHMYYHLTSCSVEVPLCAS